MLVKIFTLLSFALSGASAALCNPKDYSRSAYTADLVQEAMYFPDNTGVPMSISGSIRIVDGCTFVVDNFVFLPGFVDTLWYARSGNDTSHAMILSQTIVETNDGNHRSQSFNLTTVPGAAMSFYDFDTIVLFSRAANFEMAYATFNFSQDLNQWNRNNTRPLTNSTSTDSSTDSTHSTDPSSGATKLSPGLSSWALIVGSLMFSLL